MEKSIEQKVKEYMEILGVYIPEDPDESEE